MSSSSIASPSQLPEIYSQFLSCLIVCYLNLLVKKIIIDTDPGFDGAMAIFIALRSPKVEGRTDFPPPKGNPIKQSTAAFLVQQANLYPGKVTVVDLGPFTNIALAMELDPAFFEKHWADCCSWWCIYSKWKCYSSSGKLSQYLCKILDVYFSYNRDAYNTKRVYLHDSAALFAAVDPSLITYTEGVVRVQTSGITHEVISIYC